MLARRPPPHIAWLLRHALLGFAIGVLVGLAFIAFDVGHLRALARQEGGDIALFVLCFFCGLTCGGAQIGLAVMAMGDDDDDGGLRQPEPAPLAVPVRR